MFDVCPVCLSTLDRELGEYYKKECKCGRFIEQGYHYGMDICLDGVWYTFDESGYGNAESQAGLDEAIRQIHRSDDIKKNYQEGL